VYSCQNRNGLAAVLLFTLATTAVAQNGGEMGYDFYRPVSPLPPELQFTYDHASTALEGALRGQAQVIHASGNYWLSIAQAMICREQARTLDLLNRQRWVEYRIGLHQWLELKRQGHIDDVRRSNDAKRPTKYAVYRLDSTKLDRATGAIAWPTALEAVEFGTLRRQLETLFALRVGGASPAVATASDIAVCTRKLGDALRRHRAELDRDDYLAAQRFLCGLGFEAEAVNSSSNTFGPSPNATAQVGKPWFK
jgi:hypothetical protein